MEDTAQLRFEENYNRFYPFLIEIRKRLLFMISIFIIASIVGFVSYEKIIRLTLRILNLQGVNIVFTSPFQFLNLAVSVAFIFAISVIFPLIIHQIITFLKPALTKAEYKALLYVIPVCFFLFLSGFTFGVVMMRYVIILFYQKSMSLDIGNLLDISLLLSKILLTATFMGLAFQFPVVITILINFKVVKYKVVASQRIIAWFVALLFSALMPPTDLLSLILLTLPLVILFESTLLFNRLFVLKRLEP